METIKTDKIETLRNQWRGASNRYYERNKEAIRIKKLAHYHNKKNQSNTFEKKVIETI